MKTHLPNTRYHPSSTKRGGVCLFYKCSLPLKVIDVSYRNECINFEVKIGDKTCNFVSLCRSPSQTKDEFENFIKNLELNLEHIANKSPFLIVVLMILMRESKVGTRTI